MPFVEDFSEFAARQGCESIKLAGGTTLFANGASWTAQSFDGMGRDYTTRSEPPVEKYALLRAKRLFVQTKHQRENQEYEQALRQYQGDAKNAAKYPDSCPPVPAAALQSLRAGWDRLEVLRQELARIDAELAQAPEAIQKRADAERRAAIVAERQKTADAFCSLGINSPPPTQDIVQTVGEYFKNQTA